MEKCSSADAGCWVDGHWGWKGSSRVIQIANEFGWKGYLANLDDDDESIYDASDEAEQWMNQNVAPDGYSFGWHDGEWFLWSYEDWEEAY